jgi:hypothetical protein
MMCPLTPPHSVIWHTPGVIFDTPSGGTVRYDLNLWIGGPFEGATYLPR